MSDPDHDIRKRNLKIAENEASRELRSDTRLATWAIVAVVVIGLIAFAFFLKK